MLLIRALRRASQRLKVKGLSQKGKSLVKHRIRLYNMGQHCWHGCLGKIFKYLPQYGELFLKWGLSG